MFSMIPRLTAVAAAAVLPAVLALPPSSFAQAPAPKTDTTRGLSIQYADGRISTGPVRRTGGMWTSTFPTIAGADTSRNIVRLTTLDVKHVIDGPDVVATVSLYYGGPGQNGVTVATVRLSRDQPVAVNELRAHGVEPITLSLVAIAPTIAYAPEVVSVSPLLSARAEAVGDNVSAYRVLVTNLSTQPVMWMQFKAYRGNSLATLVRPRGKRNGPLILPNAEYTFQITTNTGGLEAADRSETWRALDRIELTSLMWQDGIVEGDSASAKDQRMVDLRRARQLEALLAALRGAARVSIADLRAQIAGGMAPTLKRGVARTRCWPISIASQRHRCLPRLRIFAPGSVAPFLSTRNGWRVSNPDRNAAAVSVRRTDMLNLHASNRRMPSRLLVERGKVEDM